MVVQGTLGKVQRRNFSSVFEYSARVQVTMLWIEKGKKGCRFTDIRLRGMAEKMA